MSDKPDDNAKEKDLTQQAADSVDSPVGTARRRMLKKGVGLAPIVLTLASRPVLAWHCKSPSAWGSEQLDPTTSLATNPGHTEYVDETWTISNWKNNTSRAGLGKPWAKLGFGDTNWNKVKVGYLLSLGLTVPPGLDTNKKMVDFLGGSGGNSFQRTVVVAQLNGYLLPSVRNCISIATLKQMATGTYSPPHLSEVWHESDIVQYLQNNWIATP